MQSSQESMREVARELGVGFVMKQSKILTQAISDYISSEFGFGDFVLHNRTTGDEIAQIRILYQNIDSIIYLEKLFVIKRIEKIIY